MISQADCELRPIQSGDLQILLRWRNSDSIRNYMYTDHRITEEEHLNWFSHLQDDKSSTHLMFLYKSSPLGSVNFKKDHKSHANYNWGFYIGEPTAPSGAGTIMCYLGLAHAFERIAAHKVIGEAFSTNTASLSLHKRLGFTQEGLFRDHVIKNGKAVDVVTFGLLSHEWNNLKTELTSTVFSGKKHPCTK